MTIRSLALALVVTLLMLVSGVGRAQWITPPERATFGVSRFDASGFDRPDPDQHRTAKRPRTASAPQPALPHWPFLNINVSQDASRDQTEPAIAMDPQNPEHLVISANDDRSDSSLWAYHSTDGGHTWHTAPLPGERPQWVVYATDPSVFFDRTGAPNVGTGHYRYNNYRTDVALYRSADLGAHWQTVGYPFVNEDPVDDTSTDKYFFTVDVSPKSPFTDRIYATWVELTNAREVRLVSSYSTDQGASWSRRTALTGPGFYNAPMAVTTPDGTVIIAYVNYTVGNDSILVVRSKDGGRTWLQAPGIAPYRDIAPVQPPGDQDGYPMIKASVCVNSFPSIAVDRSNAHPGRLYVTWCAAEPSGRVHVYLSTSDDDGAHWSAQRAIDGDTATEWTDKFFPAVAVDPATGDVGIAMNDSRSDPGNVLCDLYMLFSRDGGQTFTARRISDASSDPRIGVDQRQVGSAVFQFFGDYIGLSGVSGRWAPAWTDARSGNDLDIYSAIVEPYAPMPATDLTARDTLIHGRHARLISWHSEHVSTFGYPLQAPCTYLTRDHTPWLTLCDSSTSYLDTTLPLADVYGITIGDGSWHSTPDSVHVSGTGSVAGDERSAGDLVGEGTLEVHLHECPVEAGGTIRLETVSDIAAGIDITWWDALGRECAPAFTDQTPSFTHSISLPAPATEGILFYRVRSLGRAISSTGRVSVMPRR